MDLAIQDDVYRRAGGEIRVRRYRPAGQRAPGTTIVWLHGGAFSHGDLDMPESDAVARSFADAGHHVVTVDYRRVAPWSWWRRPAKAPLSGIRYPEPVDDVIDVVLLERARADAVDAELVLGGASAGACLAAAAALRLVREGEPGPDRLVLAYGTFHAALPPLSPQLRKRTRGRHGLVQFRPGTVERMNRNYAGRIEAMTDPFAFPGGHDLAGMPPTLVIDADRDSLRASGETFARELASAGSTVTHEVVSESTHGFLNRPGTATFDDGIGLIARWLTGTSAGSARPSVLSMTLIADAGRATTPVSPTLFGLFYEDLNRSLDGGLNANMIANHSFDGVYLNRRMHNELIAMAAKRRPRRVDDPLRHWESVQGGLRAFTDDGIRVGGGYARLTANGGVAVVENHGYQPSDDATHPTIVARSDAGALFSAWARADGFAGEFTVRMVAPSGSELSSAVVALPDASGWQRVETVLPPSQDSRCFLQIALSGTGHLDLDEVSLIPADHWGAGDSRWSQGKLRRDLVESLQDLYPKFLRFPGGCVVEGIGEGNAYDWKKTVGAVHTRIPDFNLWALRTPDGDYSQSNQIGFYEYFLLCEDLGIAAMPVVSAGISCQFRSKQTLATGGPEFEALRQDVLDLIDWATGDPATSRWAALRAEAGHPEPFDLRYIGLGNENHGNEYLEKFRILLADVEARHPGIRVVLSAGPFSRGAGFDKSWAYAAGQDAPLIVDEHFYKKPEWFIENADRYDAYPRGAATVFVGEYAAHPPTSGIGKPNDLRPNTFGSALAEAAFLTGVVRNSDVVEMTSYAPLLNRVGTRNWDHNLIDFTPDRVMRSANYEVQRVFASHLGDRIVPIDVEDAVDGVFVCSTASDLVQHVIFVNTADMAVDIVVQTPTATGTEARVVTIHGELHDANRIEFDGDPQIVIHPAESIFTMHDHAVSTSLLPRSVTVFTLDLETQGGP